MMDGNNKNTFIAIALSIMVIVAWQFLYVNPKLEVERKSAENAAKRQAEITQQAQTPTAQTSETGEAANIPNTGQSQGNIPSAQSGSTETAAASREAAVGKSERIQLETDRLVGSINLKGARIDDLRLKDYRETIDKDSPLIVLLSPSGVQDAFYAEFGWAASGTSGDVPGPNTQWNAKSGAALGVGSPVTLTWTNPNGLEFTRTISIDDKYLFTFSDEVTNKSGEAISLSPYGRIVRFGTPEVTGIYVLHEGLIGMFGEEGLRILACKMKARA